MTIITTTKEYLPFDQHSKDVQALILDKHRDINVDHEWHQYTIENITEAMQFIGWNDIKIFFSGFWSQGDGAQFNGYYVFEGKKLAKVKKEYPKWVELHDFCSELERLALLNMRDLYIKVSGNGRYCHEMATSFHIESVNPYNDIKEEQAIIECCREFMQHIYSSLNDEYDYLTSDAAIIETFEANNYEFSEDGAIL